MMESFSKIFSSFSLGNLRLKNRIVMAPMGNNLSNPQGTISEEALAYYRERAKGGVGLIITEASPVSLRGKHRGKGLGVYSDLFLPGLRQLVNTVHEQGTAIALQLHHAGRLADPRVGGGVPWAPSPIPREEGAPIPREMTLEDIREVIADFARAARWAKETGFDAVEIHGAHGYLIHQFFSPRTNQRKDKYGGNLAGRALFALEILQEIRKEVGKDYPIFFRLSAEEYLENGYHIEEARDWALELEAAGASALHISGGSTESFYGTAHAIPPMALPEAFHVPLAAEIKKIVKIPIIAVGRLGTPEVAERVIQEGQADLIAVGRAFLVDPYWPEKVTQGKREQIRPCVACNYCLSRIFQQKEIACFQNAALGKEKDVQIKRADKCKKVLIIGGGPAGLEAARVASWRGHRVTILEKKTSLGGQLLLASQPPYKKELFKAVDWLTREVQQANIKIRLGVEGNERTISEEKPDVLILATGAEPFLPQQLKSNNILTAWEALGERSAELMGKEVLILGGGMVGMETAEFLLQKGCRITIIEMQKAVALDLEGTSRALLLKRLSTKPISIMVSSKVEKIEESRVLINTSQGEKWLKADKIVLALGPQPDRKILKEAEGKVPQLFLIGDCLEPRRAKEAIHEGFFVGLNL